MHNWNLKIIVLCSFVSLSFTATAGIPRPVTIVISFDGFCYKYLDKKITPNILKLKNDGVSAPYMFNIFPTKTFPNHFSIVTGQYAEEHNVLDNKIFDPILNKTLSYSEELFTKGESTVPIWTVNEKAGGNRHSGVMMWPGSEFKYEGILPTFVEKFKWDNDYEGRVDKVVQWLTNPSAPANLIFLYFEQPDSEAHKFGADSLEVDTSLRKVDATVGHLIRKLNNHIDNYNLIILSDHGMTSVPVKNIIDLTNILTNDTYEIDALSPAIGIIPKKGYEEEIVKKLKEAANKKDSNFDFYEKHEIPDEWHYKKSFRTPPYLLVARHGYVFNDEYETFRQYAEYAKKTLTPDTIFGVHGYNPSDENMLPIFVASGPSFKKNHSVKPFHSVDLFSLFAHLVGVDITSYKHSGDFKRVEDLLATDANTGGSSALTSPIVAVLFGLLCVLIIALLLLSIRCMKSKPSDPIKWITPGPRSQNLYNVEYTALEDCHLLTVLSESDEAT